MVCIPAFNEENSIGKIIKKSFQYADKVVVCDDGSSDNTAKIAKTNGAYVISHKKNLGYGASIISLFNHAKKESADILITLDADGQHNPKHIPLLINTLKEKNVDLVIGSRFLNQESNTSTVRKFGIKVISSTSNLGTTFKVTDAQSGFRVYSKKAITSINLSEQGMSTSIEILQKASNVGLKLAETPISISYDGNTSEHNLISHGLGVFANTLKFVSVKHPLIFYGIPGIVFIIFGIVLGFNFIEVYLEDKRIFFGSLLASIILLTVGSILTATAIILFSLTTLIKK